jgi:cytochrome b subunit of formate dehydrogenase
VLFPRLLIASHRRYNRCSHWICLSDRVIPAHSGIASFVSGGLARAIPVYASLGEAMRAVPAILAG